jgi:hypothetical protein
MSRRAAVRVSGHPAPVVAAVAAVVSTAQARRVKLTGTLSEQAIKASRAQRRVGAGRARKVRAGVVCQSSLPCLSD